MINIGKILKRSWHILWNYRVLWIFGILLAITSGGAGSGSNGGSGSSGYQFNGNPGSHGIPQESSDPTIRAINQWFQQNIAPLFIHPEQHISTFILIGVGLFLFILVVSLLFALIRYPSETAVIRMVEEYEQTGRKVRFKQGWKLGWNRRAFRMWVIDLIIGLPVFLLVAMMTGLGVLVFFSVRNGSQTAIATGVIAGIGCAFLFIFAFIIVMVVLSLLRQFFVRAAALENTRIGDSFRRGWAMFKANWKSAALVWLVMLGIGIGFGIGMLIVFFLLIPVYIVLILPAAIVGLIPGLIAFGIASIFAGWPLALILGILFALPLFFLVLFAPLSLVGGWYKIFESGVWTLTYREMKTLESVAPAEIEEVTR